MIHSHNYPVHMEKEYTVKPANPVEIPCKDMDLECLPDKNGEVPFGNYKLCLAFDFSQGLCPFVSLKNKSH